MTELCFVLILPRGSQTHLWLIHGTSVCSPPPLGKEMAWMFVVMATGSRRQTFAGPDSFLLLRFTNSFNNGRQKDQKQGIRADR